MVEWGLPNSIFLQNKMVLIKLKNVNLKRIKAMLIVYIQAVTQREIHNRKHQLKDEKYK